MRFYFGPVAKPLAEALFDVILIKRYCYIVVYVYVQLYCAFVAGMQSNPLVTFHYMLFSVNNIHTLAFIYWLACLNYCRRSPHSAMVAELEEAQHANPMLTFLITVEYWSRSYKRFTPFISLKLLYFHGTLFWFLCFLSIIFSEHFQFDNLLLLFGLKAKFVY